MSESDAATGTDSATKADLHLYLQDAREALLWKVDGLSEYDLRRPVTRTGTNLLGLVKHVCAAEAAYFGETFGRPVEAPGLWVADAAEPNADLWARADESRADILDAYATVRAHADETITLLDLEAVGRVPWGRRGELTLRRVLVHVTAELHRHLGQADIIRELIDGSVGLRPGGDVMAPGDEDWWRAHHDRVEAAAREAAGHAEPNGPGPSAT
ncbi:DinB family protein [Kitasatospora sp. NPDC051853]|uniref:DinB family protein n=1 Tax=Kitasatospora sp. NPDC051853 TaxID=3364058 RepID=UPI00379AF400